MMMNFTLECEQEDDGRWIAEVPELPGVLSYGASALDAMAKAEVLALRVIADRLENSESEPLSISFSLPVLA
jgi:predicted RNase H-like HicB family nuclease